MTSLSAVPDPFQEPGASAPQTPVSIQYEQRMPTEDADSETLYQFEGKNVSGTGAKITSVATLEVDDNIWRVDEYVRIEVECRVQGVDHKVNEKTGKLTRIHVLKAVDSKVLPWDNT